MLWLLFWIVVGVIPLGLIVIGLAGYAGAESEAELPRARHLLAATTGSAVGRLCLGGVVWVGLPVADSCAGLLVLPLLAVVLGYLAAYHTARFISRILNRYTCCDCGVTFRSCYPARECRLCAEDADRVAIRRALAGFATRFHELRDDQPRA